MSANNNRTRPPVTRPTQAYRVSQLSYHSNPKTQSTSSTTPKYNKKPTNDLGSTFTARQFASNNNNGLLNDLSNKPLTTSNRPLIGSQRRTPTQSSVEQIPSSTSSMNMTMPINNESTSIPRSSSSLNQSRKSGIPTIGKHQRSNILTATRYV